MSNALINSFAPVPGETFDSWVSRTATSRPEDESIFVPIVSLASALEDADERVQVKEAYARVYAAAGIDLRTIEIIPESVDETGWGAGIRIEVPVSAYADALHLGNLIDQEARAQKLDWAKLEYGRGCIEIEGRPLPQPPGKEPKMEEATKQYANVEFPWSSIVIRENAAGEEFAKCYFPEGMTVGGADLTGYYLSPKPEFMRPNRYLLGTRRWSYEVAPDKNVWAFKDLKDADGNYLGTREHVELDPLALEAACKDWLEERKEYIAVDASRVKECQNKDTGETFYAIGGPYMRAGDAELSGYTWTAGYHTKEFERDGRKLVGFNAVKGEKIKLKPPKDSEATTAYVAAEKLARGYNAERKRRAERAKEAPSKTEERTKTKAAANTRAQSAPARKR